MVNNEIYLGSGASVTLVPEIDIYLKTASVNVAKNILTIDSAITTDVSLVNDLYVGCVLEFIDASASTGTSHTQSVTTVTFTSDLFADYDDTSIVFSKVPTTAGTTATDSAVWFKTVGETYGGSVSDVEEADISGQNTREEYAVVFAAAVNLLDNLSATRDGAVVTVTNEYGGPNTATTLYERDGTTAITDTGITASTTLGTTATTPSITLHRITSNDATTITFHPALSIVFDSSNDYFRIRGYGAPCPAPSDGTVKRLNADNWLGIVDSLTFPTNEIQFEQKNLFVGGSRNHTHQYKGVETAGGASIAVSANHGAWLYYFLGKAAVSLESTGYDNTAHPDADFLGGTADKYYINTASLNPTGPLFYRTIGTVMCPPILKGEDAVADVDMFIAPTITAGAITNPITYTFTEQEGDDLPSFALEQSFSKLPSSNTYRTNTADANEDLNFVLIATGNRVNSLNITANEKEEVKMTVDTMARKVHSLEKTESYDARRGVSDNRTFTNYSDVDTFVEPFFFSSGSISMFGQNFLRITSLDIKMDNTLTEKRYVGMGSRAIQDHVPAQRTYEITFSAMVTDDLLYNELINGAETTASSINIVFDKANGEKITLQFDNYYLTTNTWPIPEDKGAVMVDATVRARTLTNCEVITHWVLQG
jgi:hypothetical protein